MNLTNNLLKTKKYFNDNKNLIVCVNHALLGFYIHHYVLVSINHRIHYKNYFIDYYIETFQPHDNFFDILLVFAFLLQTYYDICFFHIFWFWIFLLQISFYIHILLALLFFLYRFYNNLLIILVSLLCCFDNKLFHSFFIYRKQNYKMPILSIKLELSIMLIASSLFIYQK